MIGVAVVITTLVVVLPLFGRGLLAGWARHKAINHLNRGAMTSALQWLDWAVWFDPQDGRTDLMQAACFRRLGEADRYLVTLESAQQKGAPNPSVQQEIALGQVRAGRMGRRPDLQLTSLLEAGRSVNEVAAAFVVGFLVRNQPEEANKVLNAWSADRPEDPDVAYMNGVYWHWCNELEQAETELEKALAQQPDHELARRLLAELLEEQDRLNDSYRQFHQWSTRFPGNLAARTGMARLLRKTGQIDLARAALEPYASAPSPSPLVAQEMGQLELDGGNYAAAARWFRDAPADQLGQRTLAYTVATTLALAGAPSIADQLFIQVDAALDEERQRDSVTAPQAAASGQQHSTDQNAVSPVSADAFGIQELLKTWEQPPQSHATATELYAVHCSACHGDSGNGKGRAAASLFPKPLDFRSGRFRLISTDNGVATVEDVATSIRDGIPGTSMSSFSHLGEAAVQQLAEETLRLARDGIRERMVKRWEDEVGELDEQQMQMLVQLQTTPGGAGAVPTIGPLHPEAVAHGQAIYFKLGCHLCHGDTGRGLPDGPMYNPQDKLAPPRDLVHEPFKGGREPAAIYRRLLLGMPGTLHPASPGLSEDQLIDLVQFVRSLAGETQLSETNVQRQERAWRRLVGAAESSSH